jgi:hypothetical protein
MQKAGEYFKTSKRFMDPKDQSIITEDGRRLSVENGAITGTEDTGPGLAYETGNVLDEEPSASNEGTEPGDAPDQ